MKYFVNHQLLLDPIIKTFLSSSVYGIRNYVPFNVHSTSFTRSYSKQNGNNKTIFPENISFSFLVPHIQWRQFVSAECALSQGPVFVNPNNPTATAAFQTTSSNQGNYVTQTVYGFLDFTTTIGNTVMVFSPQSTAAPEPGI